VRLWRAKRAVWYSLLAQSTGRVMAFILSADDRDADVVAQFKRYRTYLSSVRSTFPPSAFALATSDWYFNFNDHRCPHDAWIESLEFRELGSSDRQEKRELSLKLTLLGAYHDGRIEIYYPRVYAYRLDNSNSFSGHGDWRYDELRLSERGNLLHEIEWANGNAFDSWLIEASDMTLQWVPTR
jgi:hypothetical protein